MTRRSPAPRPLHVGDVLTIGSGNSPATIEIDPAGVEAGRAVPPASEIMATGASSGSSGSRRGGVAHAPGGWSLELWEIPASSEKDACGASSSSCSTDRRRGR